MPKTGNITVNGTIEKAEVETDELQTNIKNDTEVVELEVPEASLDEEVESLKARIRELEDSDVHVATTAEPPVAEELDNFEKIKLAVEDFNEAVWGDDDDEDEEDEERDDDDEEKDKKAHHFWEWR